MLLCSQSIGVTAIHDKIGRGGSYACSITIAHAPRSAGRHSRIRGRRSVPGNASRSCSRRCLDPALLRQIPQKEIDDLRRRITATRWPDRETVDDQSQGIQLAKLKPLVEYWGTGYDWRKAEAKLNALPQFMTKIDGVDIHFIHVRSKHPERPAR